MNTTPLSEGKRVSFNLGFFIGVLGAVMTATLIYARFTGQVETLQVQVQQLQTQRDHQSEEMNSMRMDLRLFIQKYNDDMNRYIRDPKDKKY